MRVSSVVLCVRGRAPGPSLEALARCLGTSCCPMLTSGAIRTVVFPAKERGGPSPSREGRASARDPIKKPPRSEGSYEQPVRGLVAERGIARGETVISVPLRGAPAALTASHAAAVLCDVFSHHGGAQLCREVANIGVVPPEGPLSATAPSPSTNTPQARRIPCITRDPLLITVAVAVMKAMDVVHPQTELGCSVPQGHQRLSPATRFFQEYVRLMPKRVPFLGALAWDSGAGADTTQPLARRLRAASGEASVPLLGAEPTDADTRALILSQVRQGTAMDAIAGGALVGASVEVVPTSRVMTSFYSGQLVRGGGQQRVHRSVESPAFLKHVGELQATLEGTVLGPLAVLLAARCSDASMAVSPTITSHRPSSRIECIDDDDVDLAATLAATTHGRSTDAAPGAAVAFWLDMLRWAHFMVRSRSLWVDLDAAQPNHSPTTGPTTSCALVPLADMLNHDGVHANVRFAEGRLAPNGKRGGVGELALHVVATRAIDAGEELTCDYNDDARRSGAVLPDGGSSAASRDAATSSALRRIEQEQRYEVVSAEHLKPRSTGLQRPAPKARTSVTAEMEAAAASVGTRTFGSAEAKRRMLDRRYEHSRKDAALVDAEWAFQFGFVKSSAEKEAEASCSWDEGLLQRVAHLTDVRRKGRPGEFVVGVPEGLRHLYAERERLQRERYGGQKVFPPQRV